jgi:hypothetical protein
MLGKQRLELNVGHVDNSCVYESKEALIGVVLKLTMEEVRVEGGFERCIIVQGDGTLSG